MQCILENGSDGSGYDIENTRQVGFANRSFGSDEYSDNGKTKIRKLMIDKSKIKPIKKDDPNIIFPF